MISDPGPDMEGGFWPCLILAYVLSFPGAALCKNFGLADNVVMIILVNGIIFSCSAVVLDGLQVQRGEEGQHESSGS